MQEAFHLYKLSSVTYFVKYMSLKRVYITLRFLKNEIAVAPRLILMVNLPIITLTKLFLLLTLLVAFYWSVIKRLTDSTTSTTSGQTNTTSGQTSTTSGQTSTTSGQTSTTSGQTSTTSEQMSTTSGQTSTTSGQTNTTSGKTSTTSWKTNTSSGRRVFRVTRQVIP